MIQHDEKIRLRLANDEDISSVKRFLDLHHVKNLNAEQRKSGFVTTDMTEQQLSHLSKQESGVLIAIDDNEKMAGLLLGASWDFLKPWPMFDYMASILHDYAFEGKSLSPMTSYQYGPICIAEEYRSRGIGERMLNYQRKVFSPHYSVIVTFVNILNPRSYAFHLRNGFQDTGFFHFNGNQYYMMALSTI